MPFNPSSASILKNLASDVIFLKTFNLLRKYNKIFENIHKLSLAIESCNREIEKVQKSMQNSNKWMDGDYNAVEF